MKPFPCLVRRAPAWIALLGAAATALAQAPPPGPPPPPTGPPPDAPPPPTEEVKPVELPDEFILEGDGEPRTVVIGKPFEVKVGDRTVSLRLKPVPYRVFADAGIRFRHSPKYSLLADVGNADVKSWVLAGDRNAILVYRHVSGPSAEEFQKDLVKNLLGEPPDPNAKTSNIELTLGGRKLKGTRLDLHQEKMRLRHDIFFFPTGKTLTALILQDSPDESGRTSPETVEATKLLVESFEFAPE